MIIFFSIYSADAAALSLSPTRFSSWLPRKYFFLIMGEHTHTHTHPHRETEHSAVLWMGTECCICLEAVTTAEDGVVRWPGCDHRVHVACMLTAAQYDVRCPLCRQVPSKVQVRPPEEDFLSETEEEELEQEATDSRLVLIWTPDRSDSSTHLRMNAAASGSRRKKGRRERLLAKRRRKFVAGGLPRV